MTKPEYTHVLVDDLIKLRVALDATSKYLDCSRNDHALSPLLDKQAELVGKLKALPLGKHEGTQGRVVVSVTSNDHVRLDVNGLVDHKIVNVKKL